MCRSNSTTLGFPGGLHTSHCAPENETSGKERAGVTELADAPPNATCAMARSLFALVGFLAVAGALAQFDCPDVSDLEVNALAKECAAAGEDVCGDKCAGRFFEVLIIDKLGGAVPCNDIAANPDAYTADSLTACAQPFIMPFIREGVNIQALLGCEIDGQEQIEKYIDRLTCSDSDKSPREVLGETLGLEEAGAILEQGVAEAKEGVSSDE